ncbi:MAG: hypothetical protein NZM06_09405 [Chloroherpetonaceae bacterium]|nr:hypothetical protein [Chloroherpetonaceae bacterium]MDW8437287.1 hypothetical protein [Chloroherpetonaceae bacterium]
MTRAFLLCLLPLVAGCGFTKMTHPEVEVLDPDTKKFIMEEVSLVSKCGSCHDNLTDKYLVYNKAVKNKTSLDKLNLLRSDSFAGAELRGYENYAESEFGFYYFYPWWYDGYVVRSGFYAATPIAEDEPMSDARRRRHSYRRGSGRLRLSSPAMPSATISAPASAPNAPAASATSNPNATTNSNSGDENTARRRSTEHSPTTEPTRRQSDGTKAQPEKRESGRIR